MGDDRGERHGITMITTARAYLVHIFTATGAIWATLAMLAAVDHKWDTMFLWLVVAFIVDGIDGPLARRYDVREKAPIIDGVLLDLIIDYLTYVFIPAYALFASGILPGWTGWCAILVINFASVLYFADSRMKTKDNSFSGFPACWNMVVLVFFALKPDFWIALAIVIALAVLMFAPLKFVHPMRTKRWSALTRPVAFLWVALAGWSAWVDFWPSSFVQWGLAITTIYLVLAGIVQQMTERPGRFSPP
ncbi:CDP-alcohol phosphatidyltransferase family protein [Haematobacter missouriensis]